MAQVLVWSDEQGPQAAWLVPATSDPDAAPPYPAWWEFRTFGPEATVNSKGTGQSWRQWAKHLAANPGAAGGSFAVQDVPDAIASPRLALAVVRQRAMLAALGSLTPVKPGIPLVR